MDPSPRFEAPQYRGGSKLEGRVALITGGDSGIGRAVATLFAREGADVAFTSLSSEQEDAEKTRTVVETEQRRALALVGDVRDFEFCKKAVEDTVFQFGRLDILVNNAAYQRHRPCIEDVSLEQWDTTFRTNIYGYFYMIKAALPYLHEDAAIINTGSITGIEGSAELIDYAASKGAIHAFTKSLAPVLVRRGIRVNCVSPGPVWTPLNPAERSADDMRDFGAHTAAGRPSQPEEIAPAFVFFASAADSSYAIGEILVLSGG
jgi:NAD(P)-dependent dehydrogenase (short-subunit alcohol dehydrogenase family)